MFQEYCNKLLSIESNLSLATIEFNIKNISSDDYIEEMVYRIRKLAA